MQLRAVLYKFMIGGWCVSMVKGGLVVWAQSIWNWMNAIGLPLFLYIIMQKPSPSVHSFMALLLWWKLLYFMKGFRATGTLVQMITITFHEVGKRTLDFTMSLPDHYTMFR